jgi:hypothetical protein
MSSPTIAHPAAPPASRNVPRAAPITIGAIFALIGTIVAVGGIALLALFGTDDRVSSGRHALSTTSTALVSEVASIDDTAEFADAFGAPSLRIAAQSDNGRELFVGVGHATDVERYLAGAPVDEITDIDFGPYDVSRKAHPGTAVPGAPGDQSFWIHQSTGLDAAADWKITDGDYRVVVMNADGTRGVQTQSKIAVELPHASSIGAGIAAAGVVLAAGGLVLLFVGIRRPRD